MGVEYLLTSQLAYSRGRGSAIYLILQLLPACHQDSLRSVCEPNSEGSRGRQAARHTVPTGKFPISYWLASIVFYAEWLWSDWMWAPPSPSNWSTFLELTLHWWRLNHEPSASAFIPISAWLITNEVNRIRHNKKWKSYNQSMSFHFPEIYWQCSVENIIILPREFLKDGLQSHYSTFLQANIVDIEKDSITNIMWFLYF